MNGSNDAPTVVLTAAQVAFLTSYVDDVCFGEDEVLKSAEKAEFVSRVTRMEFDGPATRGERAVARHLAKKGLIGRLHAHPDGPGAECIAVVFSEAGAGAMWQVMRGGEKEGACPTG